MYSCIHRLGSTAGLLVPSRQTTRTRTDLQAHHDIPGTRQQFSLFSMQNLYLRMNQDGQWVWF